MVKLISTRTQAASSEHYRAISDLTDIEKELVKRFFARINTIWGVALYRAQYPDDSAERLAMREWAFDVIKYSHQELEDRLAYAKEQMAVDPEWRYPNIALILRGRPPTKRAHHHWQDNLPESDPRLERRTERLEAPPLTGRAKIAADSLRELIK